jgi:hypothetical protein
MLANPSRSRSVLGLDPGIACNPWPVAPSRNASGSATTQPAKEQRRAWWQEIPALLCTRGLDPLGERQTHGRSYPRPVNETSVRVAARLISLSAG